MFMNFTALLEWTNRDLHASVIRFRGEFTHDFKTILSLQVEIRPSPETYLRGNLSPVGMYWINENATPGKSEVATEARTSKRVAVNSPVRCSMLQDDEHVHSKVPVEWRYFRADSSETAHPYNDQSSGSILGPDLFQKTMDVHNDGFDRLDV
jgi:hypothetical protein